MAQRDTRPAVASPPPAADRRESPRVPLRLMVREVEVGGSFEEREGNLSLGGVYFRSPHPPTGTVVELRFVVGRTEVLAVGEILHVRRRGGFFGANVKFVDLPLRHELAIARHLQRQAG